MNAVFVIVVGASLAVGLVANHRLRDRLLTSDDPGPSVADVIGQALTLAVLFLAFVLVGASDSYSRAETAAGAEADVVDHMFELANYGPDPQRQDIQAGLVCYTRAIVAYEWKNMGRGRAPEASHWSTGIRDSFAQLGRVDDERSQTLFSMLVDADRDRSTARRERINEATNTTPAAVYAIVLVTVAVSICAFAFAIPRRRNRAHVATLLILSLLLLSTLVLVRELELPFNGLARIGPSAMLDTAGDIGADYADAYGPAGLPCDRTGRAR